MEAACKILVWSESIFLAYLKSNHFCACIIYFTFLHFLNIMIGVPSENELFKLKAIVPKRYSLEAIEEAFAESIAANTRGLKKCAVLFSGGLDSSLIAFAISKNVKKTRLYCCGLKGSDAIVRASSASSLLGLKLKKVIPNQSKIADAVRDVANIIGTTNLQQIQIAVPEYLCMREIKKDSFHVVFSGQGADELFLGYDVFRRILAKHGMKEVRRAMWERIANIYKDNLSRDNAIASCLGLELRLPYLYKSFMLEALAFPSKHNLFGKDDFLRKHVLRKLALRLGMPEEICYERKKAMQYDSGIAKSVKKFLSSQGVGIKLP